MRASKFWPQSAPQTIVITWYEKRKQPVYRRTIISSRYNNKSYQSYLLRSVGLVDKKWEGSKIRSFVCVFRHPSTSTIRARNRTTLVLFVDAFGNLEETTILNQYTIIVRETPGCVESFCPVARDKCFKYYRASFFKAKRNNINILCPRLRKQLRNNDNLGPKQNRKPYHTDPIVLYSDVQARRLGFACTKVPKYIHSNTKE